MTQALLVRVTADLSVADGPSYEELGINLRAMVHTINTRYMQPQMPAIESVWSTVRTDAETFVSEQLRTLLAIPGDPGDQLDSSGSSDTSKNSGTSVTPGESEPKRSLFSRLFGTKQPSHTNRSKSLANTEFSTHSLIQEDRELVAIAQWQERLKNCDDALEAACLNALIKTIGAIMGHRGRVMSDRSLITKITVNQVCNGHGADAIDTFIEPLWQNAIKKEGYRLLPAQAKPVVMNVKGASASGKSTIRPQQRQLADKLGIAWEDFALISPDYWRKYLLDYSSLGDDYKYGAMLTGRELELIDKKLDRYMAVKAGSGHMSHLLIDRFRFDSFIVDQGSTSDSKLLSRFGDRVYLFFMVTHPAETVSRAWTRGLKTGRYKAVDDLLHHNVEAFTGMPSLFLSWINLKDKQIHFEFLDNDVPEGELPRTVALGSNHSMTVLDINLLLNIDRYRKVRIDAKQASEIFDSSDLEASTNTEFIVRCAETVSEIVFADQVSGAVYARVHGGKLIWWDNDYIQSHADSALLCDVLAALGYNGEHKEMHQVNQSDLLIDMVAEKRVTVGHWGNVDS